MSSKRWLVASTVTIGVTISILFTAILITGGRVIGVVILFTVEDQRLVRANTRRLPNVDSVPTLN